MSILLGLVFAGVAVFILFTLIINRIKSSGVKQNRRVKDSAGITNSKNNNVVELGDVSNIPITKDVHDNSNNVVDFSEVMEEAYSEESDVLSMGIDEQEDSLASDTDTNKNKGPVIQFDDNLLMLYVLSKNNQPFEGYELYQTLVDEGLVFGELDIFHFIDKDENRHIFSVTQATEPGFFDIDHFGSNIYHGLCFVMNENNTGLGKNDLDCMLEKAHVITEQLQGILCDYDKQPINSDSLAKYCQKVEQPELLVASDI